MYKTSHLKVPGSHHELTVWIDTDKASGGTLSLRVSVNPDLLEGKGAANDHPDTDDLQATASSFMRELSREMGGNKELFPRGGVRRDGESATWSAGVAPGAAVGDVQDAVQAAFGRALTTDAGRELTEQLQLADRDMGLPPTEATPAQAILKRGLQPSASRTSRFTTPHHTPGGTSRT